MPSLKLFCPPCGFPFLLHFINNFSIVFFHYPFDTYLVLYNMYTCMFVETYGITKSLYLNICTDYDHTRTVHVEGERCFFFIMCAVPQGSTTHRLDLWSWKNTQAPFHLMLFSPQLHGQFLASFIFTWATTRDKWANWPTTAYISTVCLCVFVWERIRAQTCLFSVRCMCVFMLACFF